MSIIERQCLRQGFQKFDESFWTDDLECISFFNVICYKKFVRTETEKTSSVKEKDANSKKVNAVIKIIQANLVGKEISNKERNEIARIVKMKGDLSDQDINELINTYQKLSRFSEPTIETNVEYQKRVLIARHIFINGRFEYVPYDFPVGIGWNIFKMPATLFIDPAGNQKDQSNIIELCSEFYLNSAEFQFKKLTIPENGFLGPEMHDIGIEELKKQYKELTHQCIHFKDEETYSLMFYWVLHSMLYQIWYFTPYINLFGSTSSGKSTVLITSKFLNPQSNIINDPSQSVLFRLAHSGFSLLWDENVAFANIDNPAVQSQISILRSGFTSLTGYVPRVERIQDNFEVINYSTYCPKIICSEKDIPEQLESLKNRMFHINMETSPRNLKKAWDLLLEFDDLSQKLIDFTFASFSMFNLLSLLFSKIKEGIKKEKLVFPEFLETNVENLIKICPDFLKLKHRMQDISLPIVILASGNHDDLIDINAFLVAQQELILNEVKETSPEFNLLRCLVDLMFQNGSIVTHNHFNFESKRGTPSKRNKDFGKGIEIFEEGNSFFVPLDEIIDSEPDGKIRISHKWLKKLLRSSYNVLRFTAKFMKETLKVFDVKFIIRNPKGILVYIMKPKSIEDAFRRKLKALGMDADSMVKQIKDKSVETLSKSSLESQKDEIEDSIKDKIMEYILNKKECNFLELMDALGVNEDEYDFYKKILKIMKNDSMLNLKNNGNFIFVQ